MHVLKEDELQKERSGAKKPESADEEAPEERHAVLCRTCEAEITDSSALFHMRSTSAAQVFPNPYGHMRVIVTYRSAHSLSITGAPTTEFTWFAGYSWRVAYCGECRTHLGWEFEAVADSTPRSFFGLLKDELVER